MKTRREFLRDAAIGGVALTSGILGTSALSYSRILGANDRVRVGIVGFSDRAKATLIPALLIHAKELNFEFTAVSDIWNRRRDEGAAFIKNQRPARV
jgi:hypothetical protein